MPSFATPWNLSRERAFDRLAGSIEDAHHAVAFATQLDHPAFIRFHGARESGVMQPHRGLHLGRVAVPGGGGILDVADQKGESSAWAGG